MASAKQVALSTTQVEIVAANESRTLLKMFNDTGVDIYLNDSSAVSTSNGIKWKTGTWWKEERTTLNDDFYYTGAYHGILSSGNATLYVWEKERIRNR